MDATRAGDCRVCHCLVGPISRLIGFSDPVRFRFGSMSQHGSVLCARGHLVLRRWSCLVGRLPIVAVARVARAAIRLPRHQNLIELQSPTRAGSRPRSLCVRITTGTHARGWRCVARSSMMRATNRGGKMRIAIALALSLMGTAAMAEEDIVLRGMGSFHIGGRIAEVSGKPVKEIQRVPGGPMSKLDPNGQFMVEQMYVQYLLPKARKGKYPL